MPGAYQLWNEFPAGAAIAPGALYVICHPSADAEIQAFCDTHHSFLSNGDDGYCLVQGDESAYTVVDCVGDWLADPGAGWDVCGQGSTKDSTIVRNCDVTVGNAVATGDTTGWSATTSADTCEWGVFDSNYWSEGGFHGSCGGTHASRMQILTASCEAETDQDACVAVTRDTSLEAPDTMFIPTCEWIRERVTAAGNPRPQLVESCAASGSLRQIERCEINTNSDDCNRLARQGGCLWEPMPTPDNNSTGFCSVQPLRLAEYLPYMCQGFDGGTACTTAVAGMCHTDVETGLCVLNQAALDVAHEEECLDWSPGSDCVVLGGLCTGRNSPETNLGCCISAIEDSGEELCITDDNAYDGHVDCLDEQDESPCMWSFRVQQCRDTGLADACFPSADVDTTASFTGRGGRGANGRGGGGGNSTQGAAGGGGGLVFPAECSNTCKQAIAAAQDVGCMETPELLGLTLQTITPEQWETYASVCQCQNPGTGGFGGARSPEHQVCCDNMIATLAVVEDLEHDVEATCSAEDATAMGETLASCNGHATVFPDMVCEYGFLCLGSITADLPVPTCEDYVIADIFVSGDFQATLGSDPSPVMAEAWAQFVLPDMLPGFAYKADEVLAHFMGNGITIIVGVECIGTVCPDSLIAPPPDCRRGDQAAGEPRFVCVGGPSLPEGAVLPEGATDVRIIHAYVETTARPEGWNAATAAMCANLEADFEQIGLLMCIMDEEGASVQQNAQLLGLANAARTRNRGGGGGGTGGRRQLQGFGGGGGGGTDVECSATCEAAIRPLINDCIEYSDIAAQFETPCSPDNVQAGGFDASCLMGVDYLLGICGIESVEDMLAGSCSPECGGFAGPWWNNCREHLGPLLDAELAGSSLMLEGFVAMCPTPCAETSLTEVLETVITAPMSAEAFTTAMSNAASIAAEDVNIRTLNHVSVFALSVPGQSSDYDADSTSGAANLLVSTIAAATGVDAVEISILAVTCTARELDTAAGGGFGGGGFVRPTWIETQVSVEMMIQGSGSTTAVVDAAAVLAVGILPGLGTALGVGEEDAAIVRGAIIETEVSYTLPFGTMEPTDISLMTHLYADANTFAVVNTVTRYVPEVTLRNDGSVCGTDGSVCTDDPTGSNIGNQPFDPACPDVNSDGFVGVDDLLTLLAGFGRTC